MRINLASVTGAVFAFVCWTTLLSAQTDVEARAAGITQALVKGHVAWKTKLSSPGAFIRAKEVEREGSLVRYNFYVSGLPVERLYTALAWPVTQAKPSTMMEGLSIGKGGIVICAGRTPEQCSGSQKDDPVDFTFNPTKGEPYRIALEAEDYRVAVVIVPDPISGKDKGCILSVERLLPRFELAYFTGTGFPANTEVSFDSQSYEEKHTVKTKTDSAGSLEFAILPAVTGHTKGTTSIKAVGGSCSPSVKFDWGH
jgi:hypothetical protein